MSSIGDNFGSVKLKNGILILDRILTTQIRLKMFGTLLYILAEYIFILCSIGSTIACVIQNVLLILLIEATLQLYIMIHTQYMLWMLRVSNKCASLLLPVRWTCCIKGNELLLLLYLHCLFIFFFQLAQHTHTRCIYEWCTRFHTYAADDDDDHDDDEVTYVRI